MKKLLLGLAVTGMIFTGNLNPVEARNDVYVCTFEKDNSDYYIDLDSIHKTKDKDDNTLTDLDVYIVKNDGSVQKKHYHFEYYFRTDNVLYSTDGGSLDSCDVYGRSPDTKVYIFTL